jgi:metal-dependent amidase/aminoacylase/carboxypeptidase family protein
VTGTGQSGGGAGAERAAAAAAARSAARRAAEDIRPALVGLSTAIHDEPELCFEEVRAAQRVGDMLSDAGFEVERGAYGLPTAVQARVGSGPLSIVICAEYDALPRRHRGGPAWPWRAWPTISACR